MIVHKEYMETQFVKFWIENRILYVQYKPEISIDIGTARVIVADRITFQNGKPYPILCFTGGISNSTKTGRDYLAINGSILTKAIAYIATPTVSLAMLNFFIEKNKPSVPSEIFTSEIAARDFLRPYIDL